MNTTGNNLITKCHFAKSDIIVGCQLTILTVDQQNVTIICHVSVLLSKIFMELPYSNGISVIARAVNIHGVPLDNFNITRTFIQLAPNIISSGDQCNGKYEYVLCTVNTCMCLN